MSQNITARIVGLEDSDCVSNATVASVTVDNLLLSNQQYYEICAKLNEGQQHLFNFVMQHALYCKLAEKNNDLEPKLFQLFLSWSAGFGKRFLVTAVTEYFRRGLRYSSQKLDNPSVLVTASTGKAAVNVNGIQHLTPL